MIDHRSTQADINLLKSLIGTKLLCFKSEEKDSWNRIFGNISLVTNKTEIEIRNKLTPTEYFGGGDIEDVSRFIIKQISDEHPFELMIASDIVKTSVNKTKTFNFTFIGIRLLVYLSLTGQSFQTHKSYEQSLDHEK